MDKKGQLNLNLVKAVLLAFLVLGVLVVAGALALTTLRNTDDQVGKINGALNNISTSSVVNETGVNITGTGNLRNCVIGTVYQVINTTGTVITSGNYTIVGCNIKLSSGNFLNGNISNNTVWVINASYSYNGEVFTDVLKNVSGGQASFFNNTKSIFNILFVLVILGAIAIVIFTVNRFSGGAGGDGGIDVADNFSVGKGGFKTGGGGKGGGTVMGV